MNVGTRFKLVLQISLGLLLVSLGLFSVASADHNVANASPASYSTTEVVDQPQLLLELQPVGDPGCVQQPAVSTLATSSTDATTQVTCPAGTTWTFCSACNAGGCRKSNISPLNFCKFWICVS